ncbi:MAG: hypothetical protein U9Q95_04720, partial [Candidatus Eisenbacteria bacterium]|nr:hypothetical protein [Candidatus Eisenbacteria bacterium]
GELDLVGLLGKRGAREDKAGDKAYRQYSHDPTPHLEDVVVPFPLYNVTTRSALPQESLHSISKWPFSRDPQGQLSCS